MILIQTGSGFETKPFDKGLEFQDGGVADAAGAKGFSRLQDDTWQGRFWKCSGDVADVIIWDSGNGWSVIHEVKASTENVERFWQNLERLCGAVSAADGALAAA